MLFPVKKQRIVCDESLCALLAGKRGRWYMIMLIDGQNIGPLITRWDKEWIDKRLVH